MLQFSHVTPQEDTLEDTTQSQYNSFLIIEADRGLCDRWGYYYSAGMCTDQLKQRPEQGQRSKDNVTIPLSWIMERYNNL